MKPIDTSAMKPINLDSLRAPDVQAAVDHYERRQATLDAEENLRQAVDEAVPDDDRPADLLTDRRRRGRVGLDMNIDDILNPAHSENKRAAQGIAHCDHAITIIDEHLGRLGTADTEPVREDTEPHRKDTEPMREDTEPQGATDPLDSFRRDLYQGFDPRMYKTSFLMSPPRFVAANYQESIHSELEARRATLWASAPDEDRPADLRTDAEQQGRQGMYAKLLSADLPSEDHEFVEFMASLTGTFATACAAFALWISLGSPVQASANPGKVLEARYSVLTPPSDRPTKREAQMATDAEAWGRKSGAGPS